MMKRTALLLAAGTLIPLSAYAGLGPSLGAGVATGVGAGLAAGPATGAIVGGATTGVGLLGGCAPGDIEENLVSTEKALFELSAKHEFTEAGQFKAELKELTRMKSADEKVTHMFQMVGVNPKSRTAIYQFLNERDFEVSRYADNVKANLGLDDRQAVMVLEAVTGSVTGDLK